MTKFTLVEDDLIPYNLKLIQDELENQTNYYLTELDPDTISQNKLILTTIFDNLLLQIAIKIEDNPYEGNVILTEEIDPSHNLTYPILLTILLKYIPNYLFKTLGSSKEITKLSMLTETVSPNAIQNVALNFINYVASKLNPQLKFSLQDLYTLWCELENHQKRQDLQQFLTLVDIYSYKLQQGLSVDELLEFLLENIDSRIIPLETDVDALAYAYAKTPQENRNPTTNELILKRIKKMSQK